MDTAERLLNTRVIGYGQRGALEPLARAYLDYEKNGQALPNFHGLRDYYAMVKRLSLDEMTPENIQMALARNFGGTENNTKLYEEYFGKNKLNPPFSTLVKGEFILVFIRSRDNELKSTLNQI